MFQLLLIDSESTITIMHQQNVTLNEACSASGVSWSPVHSRRQLSIMPERAYDGAYRSYAVPARFVSRSSLSLSPTILRSSSQFLSPPLMSHNQSSSTSSNFQVIFENALKTYKKCTKTDLLKHPLADRLQACDSSSSILTVLQELNESQRSNTKWLEPTVNVLHTFSNTLGEGVGSVCFRT